MGEEMVPEDEIERDKLSREGNAVDVDRNDDSQEGRLHKRSKGYDGTGENESLPIEEAESESREQETQ
jgi:hypothetical protein